MLRDLLSRFEPVNRRRAFIPQFVVPSSPFLSAISAGYVHRQGGAFQFNLEVVKNLFLFFLFFFRKKITPRTECHSWGEREKKKKIHLSIFFFNSFEPIFILVALSLEFNIKNRARLLSYVWSGNFLSHDTSQVDVTADAGFLPFFFRSQMGIALNLSNDISLRKIISETTSLLILFTFPLLD